MKICQVMSSGSAVGGLEKHFAEMCNRLAVQHEVIAIAHPAYRCLLSENVIFEPIEMNRSRYDPRVLWRLATLLRRYQPDVVHAQANKAAAMVSAVRYFVRGKLVATVHGLKKRTRMYERFDRVIAVSREVGGRVGNPNLEIIYNGIVPVPSASEIKIAANDEQANSHAVRQASNDIRKDLGIASDRKLAAAIGRLVPVKGLDVLLKAWREVDEDLLLVGDGPQRKELQLEIEQHRLTERVHLLGHREDVPEILQAVDLVVLSSRREGFPYVMVEALHARKVIVSTEVPGAIEILPREFLVPTENPVALAAAIRRTLGDLPAAERAYQSVWDFAAEQLTAAAMVEKTEFLYRRLLAA